MAQTTPSAVFNSSWQYDRANRVTQYVSADGTQNYNYDAADQLTSASGVSPNQTFSYDANGNRANTTVAGANSTYTTGANNRLINDGANSYTYDNEGNLTGRVRLSDSHGFSGSVMPTYVTRSGVPRNLNFLISPHCHASECRLESKGVHENESQFHPRWTSATMPDLIPLNLLAPGQSANVDQITGRPDQVHRLEELGLRRGARIEMVQSGSPCIIRLSGQKLCFRADELLRVLVWRGAIA